MHWDKMKNKIVEHDLICFKKKKKKNRNCCLTAIVLLCTCQSVNLSSVFFMPFHKNEIVITIGLCAQSTHKLIWFRLFTVVHCTCSLFARFSSMDLLCIRTVIKWMRMSFFSISIFSIAMLFEWRLCLLYRVTIRVYFTMAFNY